MSTEENSCLRSTPRQEPKPRRPNSSTYILSSVLCKYISKELSQKTADFQKKSPTKYAKFCFHDSRTWKTPKAKRHKEHILSPEKYIFTTKKFPLIQG